MPIAVTCPACGTKVKAPDLLAGKKARCPKCQATVQVPIVAAMPILDDLEEVSVAPSPPPAPIQSILRPLPPEPPPVPRSRDRRRPEIEPEEVFPLSSRWGRGGSGYGVASLILGSFSLLFTMLGCCTFGFTWYVSVPTALAGGVLGFFARGWLRIGGLVVGILAFLPAALITGLLIVGLKVTNVAGFRRSLEVAATQTMLHRPVMKVEVADFAKEWRANPFATFEKCKGKIVEFRGYVKGFGSNIHHQTWVTLSDKEKNFSNEVDVFLLDQNVKDGIKEFPVGSKITIQAYFNETGSTPRGIGLEILPKISVEDNPPPKQMTREEFKNKVMGKTEAEVLAAVGKPDSTQEAGGFLGKRWYYNKRTIDTVSGKVDDRIQVGFNRKTGKVDSINF